MALLHYAVLAEHMQELLYSVAAGGDTPTHQLSMMAGPELQQVMEDFNNTESLALPTPLTSGKRSLSAGPFLDISRVLMSVSCAPVSAHT